MLVMKILKEKEKKEKDKDLNKKEKREQTEKLVDEIKFKLSNQFNFAKKSNEEKSKIERIFTQKKLQENDKKDKKEKQEIESTPKA